MNNNLDLVAMDKLIKMKMEDPEKYIRYMEVLKEVANDIMLVVIDMMKQNKEEMKKLF